MIAFAAFIFIVLTSPVWIPLALGTIAIPFLIMWWIFIGIPITIFDSFENAIDKFSNNKKYEYMSKQEIDEKIMRNYIITLTTIAVILTSLGIFVNLESSNTETKHQTKQQINKSVDYTLDEIFNLKP